MTQTSDYSSLDGFTFARRKNEGDNYFKEAPVQNYSKTITKYRVGLEAEITWEMRSYDRHYLSSLLAIVSAKFREFGGTLIKKISETIPSRALVNF